MSIEIHIADPADIDARKAIVDGLVAYNFARTGINDHQPLALSITDSGGDAVGGLWGRTGFGWLFIELLFVPELMRGQGVGTQLLTRAELEALSRGCHGVWLDTFAFQARRFYEKLGYSCFGQLEDYPKGSARYFLSKALNDAVQVR